MRNKHKKQSEMEAMISYGAHHHGFTQTEGRAVIYMSHQARMMVQQEIFQVSIVSPFETGVVNSNNNLPAKKIWKPRLRWCPELHALFVKAVDELGGTDKASPKAIQTIMRVEGLTLYHLKSHLQKYRAKHGGRQLNNPKTERPRVSRKSRNMATPPSNDAGTPKTQPMACGVPNNFPAELNIEQLVADAEPLNYVYYLQFPAELLVDAQDLCDEEVG